MVQAYAFTSLCDTLINLREIYRRLFPKPTLELSIPITRTIAARRNYLDSIISKVIIELQEITGKKISADSLSEAAKLYGRMRSLQREFYEIRRKHPGAIKNHDFYAVIKAGFFLPVSNYIHLLEALIAALESISTPASRRPKLLLTGMVFDPLEVYKIFDHVGADIVDDDIANGWRTVSKNELKVENLVEGIAEYLFNPAPCCCIYNPDNDRHPYLINKVKQCGADGVVFWYIKFCEPDAFDRPQLINRLKAEGIPTTTVDLELSMTNFDAVRTRIQAFCEMLER
jgi:benzoyl-CoA reductase/2-hydroxyglutaryl-CoA dehydratase subunit BcrC/BadD/HgdB